MSKPFSAHNKIDDFFGPKTKWIIEAWTEAAKEYETTESRDPEYIEYLKRSSEAKTVKEYMKVRDEYFNDTILKFIKENQKKWETLQTIKEEDY